MNELRDLFLNILNQELNLNLVNSSQDSLEDLMVLVKAEHAY